MGRRSGQSQIGRFPTPDHAPSSTAQTNWASTAIWNATATSSSPSTNTSASSSCARLMRPASTSSNVAWSAALARRTLPRPSRCATRASALETSRPTPLEKHERPQARQTQEQTTQRARPPRKACVLQKHPCSCARGKVRILRKHAALPGMRIGPAPGRRKPRVRSRPRFCHLQEGNRELPVASHESDGYDQDFFENRRIVFEAGYYEHLVEGVASFFDARPDLRCIVDVGCGEGFYAKRLIAPRTDKSAPAPSETCPLPSRTLIGLDLSKEALQVAARGGNDVCWIGATSQRFPCRIPAWTPFLTSSRPLITLNSHACSNQAAFSSRSSPARTT